MEKYLKYLLFAGLFVFMTACPFEAPFPIDQPGIKYSPAMIGKWATSGEMESETPSYYVISDEDGYSFTIEEYTYDSDEESYSTEEYRAHLSEVGNYKFVNVFDYSSETWYFYRLDWEDPDAFSLYPVTEYITETFDSSEEMKIFFEKYKDLSFFYESSETYKRVE